MKPPLGMLLRVQLLLLLQVRLQPPSQVLHRTRCRVMARGSDVNVDAADEAESDCWPEHQWWLLFNMKSSGLPTVTTESKADAHHRLQDVLCIVWHVSSRRALIHIGSGLFLSPLFFSASGRECLGLRVMNRSFALHDSDRLLSTLRGARNTSQGVLRTAPPGRPAFRRALLSGHQTIIDYGSL